MIKQHINEVITSWTKSLSHGMYIKIQQLHNYWDTIYPSTRIIAQYTYVSIFPEKTKLHKCPENSTLHIKPSPNLSNINTAE
jgi:hypothetical protein